MNNTTKILTLLIVVILLSSASKGEIANYDLHIINSQNDQERFYSSRAINNNGQVVGVGFINDTQYPLIWDVNSGFNTFPDGGVAGGINDHGQVIVSSPFRVYDSDGTAIYTHDEYDSIGTDINNNTRATGVCIFDEPYGHAFLWGQTAGMEDIGTLGGDKSYGYAINDNGDIVGRSSVDSGMLADDYAFLWARDDGMVNLGTLPTFDLGSCAYDINNSNKIIGESYSSIATHAFIWDNDNGMQDIGTLLGHSSAVAINDFGLVIGKSYDYDSPSIGFIWSEADGMVSISDLLTFSYSGYNILDAYDINNHNQIVALAELDGEQYHVLLTPVPEPTSILFFLAGSMAFLRKKGVMSKTKNEVKRKAI